MWKKNTLVAASVLLAIGIVGTVLVINNDDGDISDSVDYSDDHLNVELMEEPQQQMQAMRLLDSETRTESLFLNSQYYFGPTLNTQLPVSGYVHGKPVTGYITISKQNSNNNNNNIRRMVAQKKIKRRRKSFGKAIGFPYYGPMHLHITVTGATLNGRRVEAGDEHTRYLLSYLLKNYGGPKGITLDGTLSAKKGTLPKALTQKHASPFMGVAAEVDNIINELKSIKKKSKAY